MNRRGREDSKTLISGAECIRSGNVNPIVQHYTRKIYTGEMLLTVPIN